MTIEERLAHLVEHGRGCPRAVSLGGPSAVEAWCEQQELEVDAELADAEDAEAVAAAAEETATEEAEAATADAEARSAAAIAEAEADGGVEVETTPELRPLTPEGDTAEDILERLSVLERAVEGLARAVDALAVSGPPVEAVEAVAASPKPKGKGGKKAGKK